MSITKGALFISVLLASHAVWAQGTPVGLWKVLDDDTKQPVALVRIVDAGGVLSGKIEKLLILRRRMRSATNAPTSAKASRCSA